MTTTTAGSPAESISEAADLEHGDVILPGAVIGPFTLNQNVTVKRVEEGNHENVGLVLWRVGTVWLPGRTLLPVKARTTT